REAKKFKEAEDLLNGVIDGNDKTPPWGAGRLYFRKELGTLYEDKAASITVAKDAKVEWGKAVKEWQTIQGIQRNRIQKIPPLPKDASAEQKEAHQKQLTDARNAYADAFFDVNRCFLKAQQQLLKGQPPEKIQAVYNDVGQGFAKMEVQIPPAEWQPE